MYRITIENGNVVVVAETEGYGIYLDNDSLIDLAKGSAARQKRFVAALQAKATCCSLGRTRPRSRALLTQLERCATFLTVSAHTGYPSNCARGESRSARRQGFGVKPSFRRASCRHIFRIGP